MIHLQEDALACILALDGFYIDGRNMRASYGTSKYCSAFIKNVRCNNPDCTYLHGMGASEDTFTKQEIQAGYVTSGRDVLARQQQLAAANGSTTIRRRVGMGGPSGSGKVASNPVFPPPTYEEPIKPSQTSLVPPPPPATSSTTQFPPVSSSAMQRSATNNGIAGFSSVAAGNGVSSTGPLSKMSRSTSLPSTSNGATAISTPKPQPALTPAEMLSRQQEELRKRHPQNSTNSNNNKKAAAIPATATTVAPSAVSSDHQSSSQPTAAERSALVPPSTTAASIVAGVHSTSKPSTSQPAPHTTLTALTPLKRASSLPEKKEPAIQPKSVTGTTSDTSMLKSQNVSGTKGLSSSQHSALFDQRKDTFLGGGQTIDATMKLSALRSNSTSLNDSNGPPVSGMKNQISGSNSTLGVASIGGRVIGGSGSAPLSAPIGSFGSLNSSANSGLGGHVGPMSGSHLLGSIGPSSLESQNSNVSGQPIGGFGSGGINSLGSGAIGGSSLLSQPLGSSGFDRSQMSLGGEAKANANASEGFFGGSDFGSIGGTGLWHQSTQNNTIRSSSVTQNIAGFGGNILDNTSSLMPPTSNNSNVPRDNVSGSSALASMLGIQLPTGVGSLRETLWASSTPLKDPYSEVKMNTPTPIGAGIKKSNVIGGQSRRIPIGGYEIGSQSSMNSGVPIGGYGSSNGSANSGNKSDVALLQSLLPGVHITAGNAHQPAAPGNSYGSSDWNGGIGGFGQGQSLIGGLMPNQRQRDEDAWNKGNGFGYSQAPGPKKENTRKQNQPNIW